MKDLLLMEKDISGEYVFSDSAQFQKGGKWLLNGQEMAREKAKTKLQKQLDKRLKEKNTELMKSNNLVDNIREGKEKINGFYWAFYDGELIHGRFIKRSYSTGGVFLATDQGHTLIVKKLYSKHTF